MPIRPSAASFGISFLGKVLRLVPLPDVGANLGFGEFADGSAEQLLLFGQPEIHRLTSVSRHFWDARLRRAVYFVEACS